MKTATRHKKERLADLQAFIDLCFAVLNEPDMKEIANRTMLSVSTLYRLAGHYPDQPLTLAVHFGTVQALGLAAGLKIQAVETGYTVTLVD